MGHRIWCNRGILITCPSHCSCCWVIMASILLSKYFSVKHMIMPGNSQNMLERAYVKALQGLDMMAVGYPSFTAREGDGGTDCLVYGDLCGEMKVLVLKDSVLESLKGS